VAVRLREMSSVRDAPPLDISRMIGALEERLGIAYAPIQKKALQTAAACQVMVVTGGPGTGKTTLIGPYWRSMRSWASGPP
jgi:exodeoxyribonuclease V alpha subunit